MKYKSLTHTPFGGENAEQYNALRSALRTAAEDFGHKGEYAEYDLMKKAPRTSFIVDLVEALHKHGYEIRRKSDNHSA